MSPERKTICVESIRVVSLRLMPTGDSYTVRDRDVDDVLAEIVSAAESEETQSYVVDFYDMPLAEFEALPEWEGF